MFHAASAIDLAHAHRLLYHMQDCVRRVYLCIRIRNSRRESSESIEGDVVVPTNENKTKF